jgi:hypothetical protein
VYSRKFVRRFQCHQSILRGEKILKPTIGNESLHEISNDNGVRLVNFATSKTLSVQGIMIQHRNIHKSIWTSSVGTTKKIGHILVDRRRHSSILDVRSFRVADCEIDLYLVAATIRRLAMSVQIMDMAHMDKFNLKKLNEV